MSVDAIPRQAARRSTWALWSSLLIALLILNTARLVGRSMAVVTLSHLCSLVIVIPCTATLLAIGMLVADELVARGARRARTQALVVLLACAAASLVHDRLLPVILPGAFSASIDHWQSALLVFLDQVLISGFTVLVLTNLRDAREAGARRHAAEVARLDIGRRTLESKLQAMQARVEPQFLFNTLAQVHRLYAVDPEAGDKMLDDLIAYLRAALPQLRESASTLGKEAELVRAYLEIMRVRLGERLVFEIHLPAAHADARVPPMMLLPLIDHALAAAGSPVLLRVEASVAAGRLLLVVADGGTAFCPGAPAGVLDELGERLHVLYGDAAAFRRGLLQDGSAATLDLPFEPFARS